MTINKLRDRDIKKNNQGDVLEKLPPITVSGTDVLANGVMIDDPDRDPSVSPLLWEIRRERAVELIYEGFRQDDLRRWKKFEYLRTVEVDGPEVEKWSHEVADSNGFVDVSHTVEIFGTCRDCALAG